MADVPWGPGPGQLRTWWSGELPVGAFACYIAFLSSSLQQPEGRTGMNRDRRRTDMDTALPELEPRDHGRPGPDRLPAGKGDSLDDVRGLVAIALPELTTPDQAAIETIRKLIETGARNGDPVAALREAAIRADNEGRFDHMDLDGFVEWIRLQTLPAGVKSTLRGPFDLYADFDAFLGVINWRYIRFDIGWRVAATSSDVDDILQEVCIVLYKKWTNRSFRSACEARGFAVRVARNKAINAYRAMVRRHETPFDTSTTPEVTNTTPDRNGDDPGERMDRDSLHDDLLEFLEQLPPKIRRAVVLHSWQGMTMESIAEKLGVSKATVSRWIKAALLELKEKLEGKGY